MHWAEIASTRLADQTIAFQASRRFPKTCPMCSELFRIPIDWLNASAVGEISVGMLLAMAIGVGILKLLAWGRKSNRSAEARGYVPGLVIIALALVFVPRFVTGIPIRGYGVMVLLGSLTGIMMAVHRTRQMNLSPDVLFSLVIGMFICGIIGARLFFVIEYWDTKFQSDSWRTTLFEALKFTEGGLVVYGSVIGGSIALLVFAKQHRIPPLVLTDLIAPSLLAALAFGRIGCLLNGCCYGGESNQPWAVTFPRDSIPYIEQVVSGRMFGFTLTEPIDEVDQSEDRATVENSLPIVSSVEPSTSSSSALQVGTKITRINDEQVRGLEQAQHVLFAAFSAGEPVQLVDLEGRQYDFPAAPMPARSLPVHPTQIYSAVHAALLSWVLWSYYPLRRRDGEVTALMLTIYPISRFLLEWIRIDESAVFNTGLSISQNISIVVFAGAIGLWIYLLRQQPRRAEVVLAS